MTAQTVARGRRHMLARILAALMSGTALAALTQPAAAQLAAAPPTVTAPGAAKTAAPPAVTTPADTSDGLALQEVVVTAIASPRAKLTSSVSISTLTPDQISQSAPTNAADILRNIPGIRAEASGGEGNANISVRGLPVASGGGKFVQFQEDGLPVLQFGDIDFFTPDTVLRADFNIRRVEVVRGGSASTFASDAPGGVFNFISKTGETTGGNIGVTTGLDFDQNRVDADYGGQLGGGWRFHVGGFYREGEGPRTVGYQAENGGQVKANVTHEWDNGDFVRLDFKYLDDRAPVYLPVPLVISGSASDPHVASIPGFSVLNGALQSPNFEHDLAIDASGNRLATDIRDGYRTRSLNAGVQMRFALGGGWDLSEKFRVSRNDGGFTGQYAQQVDTASALAADIGGSGATLRYASGGAVGQTIANPGALNGNGLATRVALFNVSLGDLGNIVNDITLTKSFITQSLGHFDVTFGNFTSNQDIKEDWHWNTYLEGVAGKNATLLDVVQANGQLATQGGLIAYGEPFFGNCCVRSYDTHYVTEAPYAAVSWGWDKLNVDASIRYDITHAAGSYAGSTGVVPFDVNGDGVLQAPETAVPIVDLASAAPVDYTKSFISYSIGVNYALDPNLAVFVRGSRGGHANAERLLFGGGINPDGGISSDAAINEVSQVEGGVKWRTRNFSAFVTGFYANTSEQNQDVTSTTQRFISRVYDAEGVEIEAAFHVGGFGVNGGATYTHSRISSDAITPGDVGNVPQRQADWVFQVTPQYTWRALTVGANVIGTTDSFADTTNTLVMPGYTEVNAFLQYQVTPKLLFSVNGNNIFDTIGITEIDAVTNGVAANGLNTARSILGRTVTASLRYSF